MLKPKIITTIFNLTYPLISCYYKHMENTPKTEEKSRGGRPSTVGASVKTTILMDPERMEALNSLASGTQRSRNSLLREAIDDLLTKHGSVH